MIKLATKIGEDRFTTIKSGVKMADVILVATSPNAIFDVISVMGEITDKVIIDASYSVGVIPAPYPTVFHALVAETNAEDVKCFNTTGFENMLNPNYNGIAIDTFMAGDSNKAKEVAKQLALDAGFGECIDFGKADKVELLEKFALSWINLAIMQGHGRNIAFKVLRR